MGVQPHQKDIAVGRKYGYHQERGPAGQALDKSKQKFGAFTGEGRGFNTKVGPDGVVMWKVDNQEKRTGRVDAYGADWFVAPEWAQRSYNNPARSEYAASHPDQWNSPNGWENFKVFQGLQQEASNLGWVQGADGSWGPEGQAPVRNAEGWAVGQMGWNGGGGGTPTPGTPDPGAAGPWGDTGGGGFSSPFTEGVIEGMGKKKKVKASSEPYNPFGSGTF